MFCVLNETPTPPPQYVCSYVLNRRIVSVAVFMFFEQPFLFVIAIFDGGGYNTAQPAK